MAKKQGTFIEIKPDKIGCQYEAYYKQEENGMFSWFIPGFKIYFSTKTFEDGQKRGNAMTQSFVKYWIYKVSYREFILQIHKLGFKASHHHDLTVSNLIRRKVSEARFMANSQLIPHEFNNSVLSENEMELAH